MPLYATYNWTNAEQVRQDGFSIDCATDIGNDGLHLSAMGENKIGNLMFNFFKNDVSSKNWFNQSNGLKIDNTAVENKLLIYPNPSTHGFNLQNNHTTKVQYTIYNSMGQLVDNGLIEENGKTTINTDFWRKGVYLYIDNLGHSFKLLLE